ARVSASKDKMLFSYAFPAIDIDTLAQAIEICKGLVIGLHGSNNGSWLSEEPVPPKDGEALWSHYMYFGKAFSENGVKKIKGLQSWGPKAGNRGWQNLTEAYINTVVNKPAGMVNVGPAVWNGIALVFNPDSPIKGFVHNFNSDIKFGDQGAEVVALQQALQLDGVFPYSVPCSGLYGNITRQAVLKFQLKYQVASEIVLDTLMGKSVGPATRAKLNEIFYIQ
ncbi:hypothetical protein KGQ31_03240, partial [Patescibacteria group bacterium]|nr:hypothetical protein [Patescibacteria group bacterium]